MMPSDILIFFYFIMWYFLLGMSILFIISGLDDFFIDVYYWTDHFYRKWKYRHEPPLTYQKLINRKEQLIAVLLPCWHEAGVIGTMLQHNCSSIDYQNYHIFVGVYPNDPQTVADVQSVASKNPHVHCVINQDPGPTNKARNLNFVYQYIKDYERTTQQIFDIFVFHDSEDIIHPRSFLLYNYLMPKMEMIQIPILPLARPYLNFTHWMYADEFAENHTKDMIVREQIHGHVPSAGVGTAFARQTLELLEDPETKCPFAIDSLTEDYRTSLLISMYKLRQAFVFQKVSRLVWVEKGIFRKRYVEEEQKEIIATRALFPLEYTKAVRQKTRWIIGIVFQEWNHTKWPKSWKLCYTLAHDRKGAVTHFINGFGYLLFLFWVCYSYFTFDKPEYPTLQEQFNLHPWVWWLIIIVSILMLDRIAQRVIAMLRVYGPIPALLAIPRTFYVNLLNLHALIRAYLIYFSTPKTNTSAKQPAWDKTDHHFPGSHILTPFKKRLGDMLVDEKIITAEQLREFIVEQSDTGERLGHLLVRKQIISKHKLLELLSIQYKLDLFPENKLLEFKSHCIDQIPKPILQWLEKKKVVPVGFDAHRQSIVLAITDPTNELLIEKTINYIQPLKAKFVIIEPSENTDSC